jgi:hypothetical protein
MLQIGYKTVTWVFLHIVICVVTSILAHIATTIPNA